MKNYYELLEVNPKASKEIIEKAYRVLIKQCHPDLYVGEEKMYAENKTAQLNEAYRILTNDFLRNQYDLELQKETNFQRSNFNKKSNIGNENIDNSKNYNRLEQNSIPDEEKKQYKVGTVMSMVDIFTTVFKKRKFKGEKNTREVKREDWVAAGITLAIVVVLGIILWLIPATNEIIKSIF